MDTQKRQQKRPATAATETKTEAQRQRAEAQEEQLEAVGPRHPLCHHDVTWP